MTAPEPGVMTGRQPSEGAAMTEAEPGSASDRPSEGVGRDVEDRLLDVSFADDLAERWSHVQARFVDDPQDAVRSADEIVHEAMSAITDRLASTRAQLQAHWARDEQPDTEQLRRALQDYRTVLGSLIDR